MATKSEIFSVRIEPEKNEKLSQICRYLNLSRQELLLLAIDHLIDLYRILIDYPDDVLEKEADKILKELQSTGKLVIKGDYGKLSFATKIVALGDIAEYSPTIKKEILPEIESRYNLKYFEEEEEGERLDLDFDDISYLYLMEKVGIMKNPPEDFEEVLDFDQYSTEIKIRLIVLCIEEAIKTMGVAEFFREIFERYNEIEGEIVKQIEINAEESPKVGRGVIEYPVKWI